jgi:hypothetical protein
MGALRQEKELRDRPSARKGAQGPPFDKNRSSGTALRQEKELRDRPSAKTGAQGPPFEVQAVWPM